MKYLVTSTKPWTKRIYDEVIRRYPGDWSYIDVPEQLTLETVRELKPRFIFFLHWSRKVPAELVKEFECVCFHMTNVPYGRGGSPLQNLIVRGHTQTKLTAFRMVDEMDAGPVYLKEDLSLHGNAEEIYIRASELSAKMIRRILSEQLTPIPQTGEPTIFKRRKPSESEMGTHEQLGSLYDFIRMLDAEGYPRAFLRHGEYRFEFSRPALYEGRIVADVTIIREKQEHR